MPSRPPGAKAGLGPHGRGWLIQAGRSVIHRCLLHPRHSLMRLFLRVGIRGLTSTSAQTRRNPTAPRRWIGRLRFAVYHRCPRLESSGAVIKGDCWLYQPAGTPIFVQPGRRLGVTCVDVETDVLRPVHISVERRITRTAHVQATLNTMTIVFSTANATRRRRVASAVGKTRVSELSVAYTSARRVRRRSTLM